MLRGMEKVFGRSLAMTFADFYNILQWRCFRIPIPTCRWAVYYKVVPAPSSPVEVQLQRVYIPSKPFDWYFCIVCLNMFPIINRNPLAAVQLSLASMQSGCNCSYVPNWRRQPQTMPNFIYAASCGFSPKSCGFSGGFVSCKLSTSQ